MKVTIEFFRVDEKKPYDGQMLIAVDGGDVFTGYVEDGVFRVSESGMSFPFDKDNVDYWTKADHLTGEIYK